MKKDTKTITEEAAEWFVELRDLEANPPDHSPEQIQQRQQTFKQWLAQSPEHVHEYLMITRLWGDVGELEGADQPASGVAAEDDSLKADNAIHLQPRGENRRRRRPWHYYAAVACLLVAIGSLLLWPASTLNYATGLGEQQTIALEDGSEVQLNTETEIRVNLGASERRVSLVRGEALFSVASDVDRPFIVDTRVASSPAHVRVLGTRFNIYQHRQHTSITVLEGRVQAAAGSYRETAAKSSESGFNAEVQGQQKVQLRGGQQLLMTLATAEGQAGQAPQQATINMQLADNIDVKKAIAWTEQKLIFDDQPLREIVEEFNRYNSSRLRIEGQKLQQMRLSGVFNSRNPDSLVSYLEQLSGIKVMSEPDGTRIITENR